MQYRNARFNRKLFKPRRRTIAFVTLKEQPEYKLAFVENNTTNK